MTKYNKEHTVLQTKYLFIRGSKGDFIKDFTLKNGNMH